MLLFLQQKCTLIQWWKSGSFYLLYSLEVVMLLCTQSCTAAFVVNEPFTIRCLMIVLIIKMVSFMSIQVSEMIEYVRQVQVIYEIIQFNFKDRVSHVLHY